MGERAIWTLSNYARFFLFIVLDHAANTAKIFGCFKDPPKFRPIFNKRESTTYSP